MNIPYRTQRVLKRIGVFLLIVLAALAVVGLCWLLWVQRYIIYTADGKAKLDFNLPPIAQGEPATPPEKEDVTIRFEAGEQQIITSTELVQMEGYYVELADLLDMPALKEQILKLPLGTPIMLDVKNPYDGFYYSSGVRSSRSSQVDIAKMDEFITWLNKQNIYTIARLPALRFGAATMYDFTAPGTDQIPNSVMHSSGGYSYPDTQSGLTYYWLHPSRQETVSYLTQVVTELRNLGFDEVVLEDFGFPDSPNILVNGDKSELLTNVAATLLKNCATDAFAVSFVQTVPFTMPEGRSRLYLIGLDASQATSAALNSGIADTAVKLVFLTELHDTRFNVYSVLRPISGADVGE